MASLYPCRYNQEGEDEHEEEENEEEKEELECLFVNPTCHFSIVLYCVIYMFIIIYNLYFKVKPTLKKTWF